MTDTTPEAPETEGTETTEAKPGRRGVGVRLPAPKDVSEEARTGYAVYDRTLGRYVTEVTKAKPSAKDAKAAAGDHPYAIVAV